MKKSLLIRAIVGIALSLCAVFSCVGFAQMVDDVSVSGSIVVKEQKGVFICDVEPVDPSDVQTNGYIATVLNSTVNLDGNKKDSEVVKITVKNNSEDVYGYVGTLRQIGIDETTYSNGDIAYAVYADAACTIPLAKKTRVDPNEYLDFYVKFYYTDAAQVAPEGESLNSVLNFKFVTPIEEIPATNEEFLILDVLEKFRIILNTNNEHVDLYNGMQAKYNGQDWHVTYIGNVAGSAHIDTEVLNDLFDNILTLNVDGSDINITLIVKMENIDNNYNNGSSYTVPNKPNDVKTGCEMTLYMTAKQIKAEGYGHLSYINPVYAAVFTKDAGDDLWYHTGEVYSGEAQCVGYVGGNDDDSFDTGTWRSTVNYYNQGRYVGISKIITAPYTSKSALSAKINEAKALDQTHYTNQSWQVLQEKIALAEATNKSSVVTQATVVARAREIQRAIDELELQVE